MAATSASETVVVVAGGDPVDPRHLRADLAGARVIAADSGVDQALALGLPVDLAIGDFDSVTASGLERAVAAGATVERHPVAKDATDLELALDAALAHCPAHIHVLGGHGGRLDHLLGNVLLLAADHLRDVEVTAQMGTALVTVIRWEAPLQGPPGQLVSLLPVHGPAVGVTTDGLRYPLDDETLTPGSTRGISNQLLQGAAVVTLRAGVLLAVQPGPLGPDPQEPTP